MRTQRWIKSIFFREQDRGDVTLGSKVRLNPSLGELGGLELLAVAGVYPLDADLFARTRTISMTALRRILAFEAELIEPTGTTVRFRVSDGASDFYWNGAAWTVTTSQWSTEAEVAANIGAFPVTTRKFAFVINLKTVKAKVSPSVFALKVLVDTSHDSLDDILLRSLIPALRTMRPLTRLLFTMPAASTTFNLAAVARETGYSLTGIDSIFNHTTDGAHKVDLFKSFAGGVVTLTTSVPQGNVLWIEAEYEPEVALRTSQDFIERARVPAVTLEEVLLTSLTRVESGRQIIRNKAQATAFQVEGPEQSDLSIVGMLEASTLVDLLRLMSEIRRFFQLTPLLRSTGTDELVRLWLIDEGRISTVGGQDGIHITRFTFQVMNFKTWYVSSDAPVSLVKRVIATVRR